MNEVYLIVGMALVTFAIRAVLLVFADSVSFPPLLKRALNYVPIAVLTGIIFPAVFVKQQALMFSLENAYIVGAIVAVLVSLRWRNMLLTVVLGMAVFLLWKYLLTTF